MNLASSAHHRALSVNFPPLPGMSADIRPWGPNAILKLFYRGIPAEAVALEMRHARLARQLGLATPDLLDSVEVEGRLGLIFERIDGPTVYALIENQKPSIERFDSMSFANNSTSLNALGRTFFDAQQSIHQCQSNELEPMQAKLAQLVRKSHQVPEVLKQEAINALHGAPIVQTVCHGDFHPQNLLLTSDGAAIIDWQDMACGDPALDVARTLLYLTHGRQAKLSDAVRDEFVHGYLTRCREVWAGRMDQLGRWQRPVIATRLAVNRVDDTERAELLRLLNAPFTNWLGAA